MDPSVHAELLLESIQRHEWEEKKRDEERYSKREIERERVRERERGRERMNKKDHRGQSGWEKKGSSCWSPAHRGGTQEVWQRWHAWVQGPQCGLSPYMKKITSGS